MGFSGMHVMVCHWVCSSHRVENSYRLLLQNPAFEDKIFSDLFTLELTDSEDKCTKIIRNVANYNPKNIT